MDLLAIRWRQYISAHIFPYGCPFSFGFSYRCCIDLYVHCPKTNQWQTQRIEFFYAAVGLLFVETFVNTFIFVFFINLPEGIWVFIENSTGFPRYGSSIFGLIHNFFGIFISHIIAIVLLLLAMKNRYLLNTLPVGSILVKKSQPVNSVNRAQGQYRECPFCAETVLAKAKLCKHCRSKI